MRKLSIGLLTLALAAVVFTSCKKEDKAAPVISFTNIADSVTTVEATADNYDLTIVVTSEAGLKEVKISEDKNGTKTDKETITTFTDEASLTKVYTVSGIPSTGMDVIVSATDKDDQNSTRTITITKKGAAALTTVTFAETIGAGGASQGSYVDLESGEVYGYSEVTGDAAKKGAVDAVFNLSSLYNTGNGLDAAGTGTKFGATTLTAATYATATAAALVGLTATLDDIAVEKDKIIYFVTKAGKKGLIWIKTYTPSTTGTTGGGNATITIEAKTE